MRDGMGQRETEAATPREGRAGPSVGVGWTPVPEEVETSFLRVERTTSLEAERYRMVRCRRHAVTPRQKPWCGLGGQHRGLDRRNRPDREYCLKFVTF